MLLFCVFDLDFIPPAPWSLIWIILTQTAASGCVDDGHTRLHTLQGGEEWYLHNRDKTSPNRTDKEALNLLLVLAVAILPIDFASVI